MVLTHFNHDRGRPRGPTMHPDRIVMPRCRVGMTIFATSPASRLLAFSVSQTILTRRVTWPLLSQYVCFLAIKGSSIAG